MTKQILSASIHQMPLSALKAWDANPRMNMDGDETQQMKASLLASGLLQNFIAAPCPSGEGHVVIAGARRLAAAQALIADGAVSADSLVNVAVRDIDLNDPEALKIALTENTVRSQMDAIDECIAMAELAQRGENIESIAAAFGLGTQTVKQRLALGRLVPEAQEMVRNKTRDLDWAKGMSMADQATQTRIVTDIAGNPNAWKDGNTIRRFLTQDTIPATNALFEMSAYQGRVIYDMFGSDQLADRDEFWALQNEQIDILKADLEAQGYQEVSISHQPVDTWRFQRTDKPEDSIAIIEVMPNGRVTQHTGLVKTDDLPTVENAPEVSDEIETVEIASDGVRVTPAIAEYAAAHRTAMVQNAMAGSFRTALEVMTAGLIGHSEIAVRAHDYRYPGSPEVRTAKVFDEVTQLRDDVNEELLSGGAVGAGAGRDPQIMALVKSLPDTDLQSLFTRLTALKIGQAQPKTLDGNPDSLMNDLGTALAVEVRAHWTPDETFFALMQPADMRRLIAALLPLDRQAGVASAKKKALARMLTDAFADAAENDGSMAAADAQRLNTWVPGVMRFPAVDETVEGEQVEADTSAFDALFGADGSDADQDTGQDAGEDADADAGSEVADEAA
ncbi:hypothetical protein CKO28_00060 [Rhodovibrio sodomensis]|uniref:ParB-like N-terminal domain-containing protein n=1 Tax=Rhodovibrio sodomensis TaxID=1088 RepID=A0ABS1D7N9_9PROT|nr:ParB N-terminal domain-containing protein [Rhodovibrio sodomensis]MBK1666432.1 hypothetical protein [Rhodovibrio sodomensis]